MTTTMTPPTDAAVRPHCPACGYASRFPLLAAEVRLICGSCGHVYLSGDGWSVVPGSVTPGEMVARVTSDQIQYGVAR
jgi:hypothetical protein